VKLLLGLAALPLLAQTTITPPQIRLGAPGEPANLRLYAVGLSGMVQVQVGPGLRIELREGVPTLTADTGALRIVSRVLVQDQNGNYVCPQCQRVYRNGIRQAQGVDYNTNPGGILPILPWAADDVVLGEWIGTEPSAEAARPTVVPAAQVRNWAQVSPNDLIRATDDRRRPGVALSQVQASACAFWYRHRLSFQTPAAIILDCSWLAGSGGIRWSEWYHRPIAGLQFAGEQQGTVAGFKQVRNWAMLRNPNSKGTSITLDQLPMPRDVAELWRRHAARPVYDEYRVAVVPDQDYPILITCGAWGCDRSAALWYRPGG
jgi:hypothetical protein